MKRKMILLLSGIADSSIWTTGISINEKGKIYDTFFQQSDPLKTKIRDKDRTFFKRHLGAFHDKLEIHHDWENDATCFLLTSEEHLKLEKNERMGKMGGMRNEGFC